MGAEHEIRMTSKPAVHADRFFIVRGRSHLIDIEPCLGAFGLAGLALAEEENVDDDICAGVAAKAAFRHADCCDQVGGFGDVLTGGRVGLVHCAMRGDEGGKRARLQQVD